MASFSQEQVRHFREVFKEFCDENRKGIVNRDNFLLAVNLSLSQCTLRSSPSSQLLVQEFDRLVATTGVLLWQQFFQVRNNLCVCLLCTLCMCAACWNNNQCQSSGGSM